MRERSTRFVVSAHRNTSERCPKLSIASYDAQPAYKRREILAHITPATTTISSTKPTNQLFFFFKTTLHLNSYKTCPLRTLPSSKRTPRARTNPGRLGVKGSPESTQPRLILPTFLSFPITTTSVRPSQPYHLATKLLTPQLSLTAATWAEYGAQWKDHYNTKIAGKPIPTSGPTLPPLPTTDATGKDWAAWGKGVAEAWNVYAAGRGVDLAKALEGLKSPELIGDDWIAYSRQWEEYGTKVGERFRAALTAKSA